MKNLPLCTALTFGLAACDSDGPDYIWGTSKDDSGDTTETDTQDSETGDSDTDSPTEDDQEFDEPGDIVELEVEGNEITLSLEDVSGDSNQDQEFYLVLANTGSSAIGYTLKYENAEGDDTGAEDTGTSPDMMFDLPSGRGEAPEPKGFQQDPDFRAKLAELRKSPPPPVQPPPPFDETSIGVEEREFRVRNNLSKETSFSTITAKLWGLGDTVALWVDNGVAIDHVDCDTGEVLTSSLEAYGLDAYGFDNCDLQTIASIVDTNIMVNLNDILGDVSDVNQDGMVTVLITPVLNHVSTTADDPDDKGTLIESYADPEVDLTEYNYDTNPVSDYQEIIYVFAPDPEGFHSNNLITVDEYTSVSLASQIAQNVAELISYNYHMIDVDEDEDTEVEEGWVLSGLGAIAADLTGFGSVFYDDAWDTLDATHLDALLSDTSTNSMSSSSQGSSYLFMRWLVDNMGTDVLKSMTQTTDVGTENVEIASSMDMDELLLQWHVAMLTAGMTNEAGEDLVDTEEWPQYSEAETIEAPTEAPTDGAAGTYYGANGYQMGININGVNRFVEGGTTDDPTEDETERVTMGRSDHFTYTPGIEFYGYIKADGAGQVVRLTNINYDVANLIIQASGNDLQGAVIRWSDPTGDTVDDQTDSSPKLTNYVELPALPDDGTPIYALGDIADHSGYTIKAYDAAGDAQELDVYDTDRWLLDLTDRIAGEQVDVVVWLDRHYENVKGDIAPYDPWVAIAREDWVPTPDTYTIDRETCPDEEAVDFSYPVSLIDYLYFQEVLSNTPFSISTGEEEEEEEPARGDTEAFDPCGEVSELETSCRDDWDLDGVLDENEPLPSSFLEQVQVRQCDLAKAGSYDLNEEGYFTTEWFDQDERDDDDASTKDRASNTGGMADSSGEEAYLSMTLDGGERYLIIVGGYGDSGSYEVTIKESVR